MTSSPVIRRAALVLLLGTCLLAPLEAKDIPAKRQSAARKAQESRLLRVLPEAWTLIKSLWEPEGSSLDPFGTPKPSEGSSLDPFGKT